MTEVIVLISLGIAYMLATMWSIWIGMKVEVYKAEVSARSKELRK